MNKRRALSIRQPYAEQILQGVKNIEYRSRPTYIRERVYIYASMTPGKAKAFTEIGMRPGDLPTGVLVGTIEIIDCQISLIGYEWILYSPERLLNPIKPKQHPQPVWFYPF